MDTPIDTAIADPAAFVMRFLAQLPVNAAEAMAAYASTTSHDLAHSHVVGAHAMAGLAQHQAEILAAAGRAMPAGPLRAVAAQVARLHSGLIDAWLDGVNGYGRTFARKARAFPVTPAFND